MGIFRRGQKADASETGENDKKKAKAKKEQTPWSKKERMLVFWALVLTAIPALFLGLSARRWKVGGLPSLKLPDISWEQTFIIEGDMATQSELESQLTQITHAYSGIYGVYVYETGNLARWGINESQTFQAASLIKLPVIVALYQKAEEGEIDLDSTYTLKDEDKISGAGSLQNQPAGSEFTLRELVSLMGKESDNTAFGVVRNLLGDEKISDFMLRIGMKNTSLKNNTTTPEDMGILLRKLYEGKIVSVKSRDEILDFLTETNYEDWLVNGVPENVRVAHKFGRETHVLNDAGVVFTPRPYVVVIVSEGIVESEADEALVEISRFIYDTASQH